MEGIVADFLTQIIMLHSEERRAALAERLTSRSCKSRDEQAAENFNASQGDLAGDDCEICKNKGLVAYVANDFFTTKECSCMPLRKFQENMGKSGLGELLKLYRFENYQIEHDWQKTIKYRAFKYVSDLDKENGALKWFCAFGAVGSGKTHICTAICGEILKKGGKVAYMLWRDESVRLKASVNDSEKYKLAIKPFKETEVLYIDDFLKGKQGKSPTEADINLAFELINHRYNMPGSRTIISSEKSFDDILEFDAALGSRISQRCGDEYRLKVNEGDGKNQRLKTVN